MAPKRSNNVSSGATPSESSQGLSVPSSSFTFSVNPRASGSGRSLRPPSPARRQPGFVSTPSDSRRAPQAATSPPNSSQYQPSQTEEDQDLGEDEHDEHANGSQSDAASVILVTGRSTVGKKRRHIIPKKVVKNTAKSKSKKGKVSINLKFLIQIGTPFVSQII
ncbi:hypothetical protein DFH28DRAFT_1174634 [Melampsora americana]|nr:hypothetical protein DFH28DRAFT_1174634 [Melampsora americana]